MQRRLPNERRDSRVSLVELAEDVRRQLRLELGVKDVAMRQHLLSQAPGHGEPGCSNGRVFVVGQLPEQGVGQQLMVEVAVFRQVLPELGRVVLANVVDEVGVADEGGDQKSGEPRLVVFGISGLWVDQRSCRRRRQVVADGGENFRLAKQDRVATFFRRWESHAERLFRQNCRLENTRGF